MADYVQNIGNIIVGTTNKVIFKLKEPITDIAKDNKTGKPKVIKSCSCVNYQIDNKNLLFTIIYKPKNIPKHLKGQGYYFSNKSVTIYREKEGRQIEDKFRFTAKIIKK